jgi:hypothetical protein
MLAVYAAHRGGAGAASFSAAKPASSPNEAAGSQILAQQLIYII